MRIVKCFVVTLVCFAASAAASAQQSPQAADPATPTKAILRQYDEAIDDLAERAMRSVVEIEVTGYGKPEDRDDPDTQSLERQRSLGSGVIVDPDGYIVTNNHVVAGALRIRVIVSPTTVELVMGHTQLSHPQRVYEAKLIGTTSYADLAVIKIDAHDLPAIPLPQPYHIRLGQTVIAIGAPQGLDHTVTRGIISAVGRQPENDRPMVYVQTDAPINPGNSGGPLIDRDGNLVGINTFIYTSGGGSEGLGFAIPEPVVRFAYNELKANGVVRLVTIGAHAQTISPSLAAGLKLPRDFGVIFSDIVPNGPAAAAGLQPKDIVVSMDGFPIDSLPKYTAYLYIHPRGVPLDMEVLRSGKPVDLSIKPVDLPPVADSLSDLIRPKRDLVAPLGIFAVDLDNSLAEIVPGLRSNQGVLVAGLLGGEPAIQADLESGDVIRSMNGKQISNTNQLRHELTSYKPGDPVVFEIERQSTLIYVAFEVE